MKVLYLYNSNSKKSRNNAKSHIKTFESFNGWEVELFDGCSPATFTEVDKHYNFSNDRGRYKPDNVRFITKKSCFYSHVMMWEKCIEENTPITIVEHDVVCVRDYPEIAIPKRSVIQITTASIFKEFYGKLTNYDKSHKIFSSLPKGLHTVRKFHKHSTKNNDWGYTIAGNTGYIITPSAAEKLISDCEVNGWQQNDLLMNDDLVKIFHLKPSLCRYLPEKELRSSSTWKDNK